MAFLAPLAEAVGPLIARLAVGTAAKSAAGSAAEGAAGGGAESAMANMTKMGPMPIPHMGSNGPTKPAAMGQANSYLNADQFR